ncbi:MAG: efflux RND transporter periplasmic adaptor subunit [Candidatus Solibacter usitatus]|nr:efflux RND transporter periplasmic adaptor subunit [Candidatus Solibacter usitatus]
MLRVRVITALLVTVIIALNGCAPKTAASEKKGGKKGGEIPIVVTTKVSVRSVPVEIQVIGNVEAYSTVTVKAQITGLIEKVHFKEGDFVAKGAPLFSIDPSPFQASLSQVEANVARDKAILEQSRATLSRDQAQQKYQQAQAARFDNLFKQGIISKDQAEQMQTSADAISQSVKADMAAIQSAQASVAAGEAALRNSRIQLGYTSIRAPIDGRTGNLIAKEGNLASANVTELIAINEVQPIYVAFSVPESQLPTIKEFMSRGKLTVISAPPDDPANPERGTLTFVDNRVDANTGTIRLKATFDNVQRKLWPGQFVKVTVQLATRANAVVVPNQVVQTGQDGPFVYRVREDSSVEAVKVVTGSRVNEDIVIDKGLEPDDTVVLEGQLRLAPNMKIRTGGGKGGEGRKGGKKKE